MSKVLLTVAKESGYMISFVRESLLICLSVRLLALTVYRCHPRIRSVFKFCQVGLPKSHLFEFCSLPCL
jgi:hypothetical protein